MHHDSQQICSSKSATLGYIDVKLNSVAFTESLLLNKYRDDYGDYLRLLVHVVQTVVITQIAILLSKLRWLMTTSSPITIGNSITTRKLPPDFRTGMY